MRPWTIPLLFSWVAGEYEQGMGVQSAFDYSTMNTNMDMGMGLYSGVGVLSTTSLLFASVQASPLSAAGG